MTNKFIFNMDDYGTVNDGYTDCYNAWQKIMAEMGNNGGIIYFGPGQYYFSQTLTKFLPNNTQLTIKGCGKGTTQLIWNNSDGMHLSHEDTSLEACRYNIHDLSFIMDSTSLLYVGLTITNNSPIQFGGYASIQNVSFQGRDFGINQTWGAALNLNGVSFNNIIDCEFYGSGQVSNRKGNGITIAGIPERPNIVSIVTNITDCIFIGLSGGILCGNNAQGITVSQCNLTNCLFGIYLGPNVKGTDQLTVIGSQIDCINEGILLESDMDALIVSSNLFWCQQNPNASAIKMTSPHSNVITGNVFHGNGKNTTGISVSGESSIGSAANMITGNVFDGLNVAIKLTDNASGWKVINNNYAFNGQNVLGNGNPTNIIG